MNNLEINKTKKINKTAQFFTIFKLFNKYYIKSFSGPFFAFGFSFIIYAILGALMGYSVMLPGIIGMIAISQGITGMPFLILELKNSVLLKRIGASPIKTGLFTLVIVFYFIAIILLATLWLFMWGFIFSNDIHIADNLFKGARSFFTFSYGLLLNAIVGLSVGFAIASVAKTPIQAQAIGMIIYLPSAFLSGQFLSPQIIAGSDTMNFISKFLPFRYTTLLMTEGWANGNPFDLHGNFVQDVPGQLTAQDWKSFIDPVTKQLNDAAILKKIEELYKNGRSVIYNNIDHIIALFYPHVFAGIMLSVAIKKFKWSSIR